MGRKKKRRAFVTLRLVIQSLNPVLHLYNIKVRGDALRFVSAEHFDLFVKYGDNGL